MNDLNQEQLYELLEGQIEAGDFEDKPEHLSLSNDLEFMFGSLRIDLAEDLYVAMKHKGLNESQLAKKLGITRQAVNEVFAMTTNMTLKTLAKFCVALDVEPEITLKKKET